MTVEIVPLLPSHNRKNFHCGVSQLDNHLRKQAGQDIKRKLAVCFVLIDEKQNVKGFYTLSNTGIPKDILPEAISRKLPASYHYLPATLLGRLAVDMSVRGQGLGELLLMDALKRSHEVSKTEIGSMAVVVDPVNEEAVAFYKKYGFILLPDSHKMFLPMKTLEKLFGNIF